jgi:hypothetical protein
MFVIPLLKADASQRLVYGRIDETPDRAGEVFDYVSSKPHFEKWSAETQAASDGKSLGNVRGMHSKVAAGKLVSLDFDDAGKAINICAKVVDDAEWQKVEEGVYTGFSPGGSYGPKWRDGEHRRYTAIPSEMSLVDRPCIPSATFTMFKADGGTEERPFRPSESGPDLIKMLGDAVSPGDFGDIMRAAGADDLAKAFGFDPHDVPELAGMAKRDFSAADRRQLAKDGKALPDGSFPIETKQDLESAVQAVGRAKDPDAAKKHICARAKDLDATDLLPADWPGSTKAEKVDAGGAMLKGLFQVSELSRLIECLTCLANGVVVEAAMERDGSDLPQRLAAWVAAGAPILQAMATEETSEAMAGLQAALSTLPQLGTEAMALMDAGGDMAKRGARHSKADLDRLQAIHDHAVGMGAACSGDDQVEKMSGGGNLAKLAFDLAGTREDLAKMTGERDGLRKRVTELEALPAPGGPKLVVVEKGQDLGGDTGSSAEDALAKLEAMPPSREKALALAKIVLSRPGSSNRS